jgi:NAD(P)-dependent dehydrogenase (short-subunit alcohol dehydrogenase family)
MMSPDDTYTPTAQQPIGSGFGFESTAAEVLSGIDLAGKLVVLTGGYSGLGLEDTRALSAAGATVLVPARRPEHARDELAGVERVEVETLDLADLDSVRGFADGFLHSGRSIDILINNAAVMANPETRVGPGWESQFATNHLGHFALTNLLWPALASGDGARVVSVSSRGHKYSAIRWDDIDFERGYDKWEAYGQAKTATVLFALELDRLGHGSGVRAFSVYPGGILTPLQRHLEKQEMIDLGWIDEQGNVLARFKTPPQGAATSAWAATSPQLEGMGGVYCEDCDIARVADPDSEAGRAAGVNPWAIDPDQARRLWTLSAQLTGVDAFA